jgi:hypothetical protein
MRGCDSAARVGGGTGDESPKPSRAGPVLTNTWQWGLFGAGGNLFGWENISDI